MPDGVRVVERGFRITPRIGSKVWFAPKRFGGWGWQPASIEGWLLLALALLAVLAPLPSLDDGRMPWLYLAGVAAALSALLAACSFKGTSGGGRREWDEHRARADASSTGTAKDVPVPEIRQKPIDFR